jgi:ABC-type protease/lipase transport system fused ATPase/permease subunit
VSVSSPNCSPVNNDFPAGCGKSTLAKLLVGDLRPSAGSIWTDEQEVTDWPILWRRPIIGYLPAGFWFDLILC